MLHWNFTSVAQRDNRPVLRCFLIIPVELDFDDMLFACLHLNFRCVLRTIRESMVKSWPRVFCHVRSFIIVSAWRRETSVFPDVDTHFNSLVNFWGNGQLVLSVACKARATLRSLWAVVIKHEEVVLVHVFHVFVDHGIAKLFKIVFHGQENDAIVLVASSTSLSSKLSSPFTWIVAPVTVVAISTMRVS